MKTSPYARVFVVPHSHFDPEWLKTYRQYLRDEARHLRQRLDVLRHDPNYRFCASEEMATLPVLRKSGSPLRRAFRDAVRQERIEAKGMVASGELTMHTGESVARQFVLGKYLFEEELGFELDLPVAQNIDNYALCPQFPQILAQCGRRYLVLGVYETEQGGTLYLTDPPSSRPELWWRGPDGSRVLTVFSRPEYGGIGSEPEEKRTRQLVDRLRAIGSRHALFLFSGGDMVPPDPVLTDKLARWSQSNGRSKLTVGLPRQYFETVRHDKTIPVGCADAITDHLGAFESRVKARQTSRRVESLLLAAEKLATAAATVGAAYPRKKIDDAWYHLLINQQHDPALACLRDSLMSKVMRRYRHVEDQTQRVLDAALKKIASQVDTAASDGTPILVFNPLGGPRTDIASVTIRRPGRAASWIVTDGDGTVCPSFSRRRNDCSEIRFLASDVPSLGYKVFHIHKEVRRHDAAASVDFEPFEYDTTFDDDGLRSIVERSNGSRWGEDSSTLAHLDVQRDSGCAHMIRPTGASRRLKPVACRERVLGSLGRVIEYTFRFKDSRLVQCFHLYRGLPRIDVRTIVDWRNTGYRMCARFPGVGGEYWCHEPFIVNRRDLDGPTMRKPVLYWAGGFDSKHGRGIAVANRGTHSYAMDENGLCMTLLRSVDPANMTEDPRRPGSGRDRCGWCMTDYANNMATEVGRHVFEYSLLPFDRSVRDGGVHERACAFNHPLLTISMSRHGGALPPSFSFVDWDDPGLFLSTWKRAYRRDHDVLRLYEPHGQTVRRAILRLGRGRIIGDCNMDERALRRRRTSARSAITIKPYQVRSFMTQMR